MQIQRIAFGLLGLALLGCGDDSDVSDAGEPDAGELDAGEVEAVLPPPRAVIFREIDFAVEFDADGSPTRFETLLLFDDDRLRRLCKLPDADSFDDYQEIDHATGQVIIPRGTTPLSTKCPPDGIVTGPMHEELYPSSWCLIPNCTPDPSAERL